jgi:diguanylate cyclase (GGDEF)-like protein
VRTFFARTALSAQLIFLTALCLLITSGGAVMVVGWVVAARHEGPAAISESQYVAFKLTLVLCLASLLGIGLVMAAIRRLLLQPLAHLDRGMSQVIEGKLEKTPATEMPSREWGHLRDTFDRMVGQLKQAREANERSQRVLAERTKTVDRLLDFSQTVQGAGQAEQVFSALSQFLERELSLSGIAILSHESEALPPIQVRAGLPLNVLREENPVTEMKAGLCPCLRQNLPKHFRADGSPVRCAIDQCISLPDAASHQAYCIPFNVGRQMQVVVHMLLPIGEAWTEDKKQLAQTYVNTAVSSLISLHLLAEAEKQSMTDALTGLFNRRSMENLMQREVALSERHSHPLSIVMIDLDKFKQVNDVYGHAAGDHLLKSFADCVRITLRKTDLAFRYGGDEFVIALPQTPIGMAEQVVNKLRQAFAAVDFSHAIARLDHQPTLSIGVAERIPAAGIATLDNLLTAADHALYEAKSANRNCVKLYVPPRAA